MSLQRLADELEETLRQLQAMVDGVAGAVDLLHDPSLAPGDARAAAARRIVVALQAHDRIEQRCRGLAEAARGLAALPAATAPDDIWRHLVLDELRRPAASPAPAGMPGEIDLF